MLLLCSGAAGLHIVGVTCWLFRWQCVGVGRQVSTSKQVHANCDKWEWEQSEEAEEWDVRVEETASCESWDVSFWPRQENMTRKFDILSIYSILSCDWKCKMVGLCVGGCLDPGICTERFHNCSNREAFLNHTLHYCSLQCPVCSITSSPSPISLRHLLSCGLKEENDRSLQSVHLTGKRFKWSSRLCDFLLAVKS